MSVTISLKGIIDEDFVNYRVPSMTLMFPNCTFKCGKEHCQNSLLAKGKAVDISIYELCERYINNPITEAIVCQGLEPFDSWGELRSLILTLRLHYACFDDIVIYTGYNKDEISDKLKELESINNIVVKFGRYISGQQPHYDDVLGVNLVSDNQYAERIS